MHARSHKDADVVHGTTTMGDERLKGPLLHTLGWGAHHIGQLDRYKSPTKCKKVRSCDTLP